MAKQQQGRQGQARGAGGRRARVPLPPRLLTITDIAELASVSISTVRRMIADGVLPPPVDLGRPQLHRWHPEKVRAALGISDLPEEE